MAPNVPAEIDVFTVPHSRMKELVNIYTQKVQCIDYRDCQQVSTLLNELKSTLHEFKSHESIENMFIMDQLKNRLKQRHIYNSAVCDCHNDNRLTEIMKLVKSGRHFWKTSVGERITFGQELQSRFIDFVQKFLPHMEEEETIFQPLLVEHFEYDELCILKEVVLEQHELIKNPLYHEKAELDTPETDEAIKDFRDIDAECCFLGDLFSSQLNPCPDLSSLCADLGHCSSSTFLQVKSHTEQSPIYESTECKSLPMEILIMIFGYLQPPDRGRCAQVCSSWNHAVYSSTLWREIYPIQWAKGIWSWKNYNLSIEMEDEATLKMTHCSSTSKYDEDADIDESENQYDPILEHQCIVFTSLIEFVLPRVGIGVEKLILDGGHGINSRLINEALLLCPNLTHISAAYSIFDYYAFKGLWRHNSLLKLTHLDLQGCELMDDNALIALSECIKPPQQDNFVDTYHPLDFPSNFCTSVQSRNTEDGHQFNCSSCAYRKAFCCDNTSCDISCPYDVRWMSDGQSTEIEELYEQPFNCNCFGIQNCNLKCKDLFYRNYFGIKTLEKSTEAPPSLLSLNLSGCWRITDSGISSLVDSGFLRNVLLLNLGGCFHLTGPFLKHLILRCLHLVPEGLTYCNNIDGPYTTQANGCDTLCHPIKICCQTSKY